MNIKKTKKIFNKYKIFKYWINHQDSICLYKKVEDYNKIKKFVYHIEAILELLKDEDILIIKSYYIENCSKYNFPYSKSGYYYRLKKATYEFLKYYGNVNELYR